LRKAEASQGHPRCRLPRGLFIRCNPDDQLSQPDDNDVGGDDGDDEDDLVPPRRSGCSAGRFEGEAKAKMAASGDKIVWSAFLLFFAVLAEVPALKLTGENIFNTFICPFS
jgi:hypothetical protein